MSRPTPPQSNPFGTLSSRFGGSKVTWDIVPIYDTLVRFDLMGLGDPLYRLIKSKRRKDLSDLDAVIEALEETGPTLSAVTEQLDTVWESYHLRGAMLVYSWRDEVKQSVVAQATTDKSTLVCLSARDPLFVLNVLARARSHILLAGSPLALERAFLERVLIADDPRIVALAYSTGSVKETLKE
jgi:hypothetical protein